jgi:hypothetical protein
MQLEVRGDIADLLKKLEKNGFDLLVPLQAARQTNNFCHIGKVEAELQLQHQEMLTNGIVLLFSHLFLFYWQKCVLFTFLQAGHVVPIEVHQSLMVGVKFAHLRPSVFQSPSEKCVSLVTWLFFWAKRNSVVKEDPFPEKFAEQNVWRFDIVVHDPSSMQGG